MYVLYTHLQERAYCTPDGRLEGLSFAEIAHWFFPFLLLALLAFPTLHQYQSSSITKQYEVVLEPERVSLPPPALLESKAEPEPRFIDNLCDYFFGAVYPGVCFCRYFSQRSL